MSNLSDETLRKILEQIQNQAVSSQRSLSLVKSQISSRERERKILSLTMRELGSIPQDEEGVKMYKGVGKMFVMQERDEVNQTHQKSDKGLTDELATLNKKSKYLEKQFEEATSQLRDIFHSQQREQQQQS